MRRLLFGSIGVGAAIIFGGCTQDSPTELKSDQPRAARAAAKTKSEKIPNQYIVRLRDDVPNLVPRSIAIASAHGGTVRQIYTHAIKGFSLQIPDAAAAALAQHPEVLYVEQNQTVHLVTEQENATWGIDRIDQRDAPPDTKYVYNATGDGVDVYIIDTGIRTTHSEFGGRAVPGVDEVGDGWGTDDCYGHGTHVAGTVGGVTYGVAKNVRLVAVRVLDCEGGGTYEGVIAGVDWVTADHQGGQPAVANMSLAGGYFQALNDAVTNSVADGVVYAVAAANSAYDACAYSPASTPAALTIGATDIGDNEAWFSNRGTCVDMWAPGVDVTSAWIYDDNSTETISGTSMATPHVAGAVALYLQGNPTATADDVDDALTSNATTGKITWYAGGSQPPPPPPGQDYLLYTGFIGATPPEPPTAPTELAATASSFSSIHLAWSDNSSNENAFRIERCQDAGAPCADFAQVALIGQNQTAYDDYGLSGSTTYRYRIRAYNSGGNSEYSNVADATTPEAPPPPAAPSGLAATAVSQYEIDLAWTDNSSNEWYFYIERCQDFGTACTDFQFHSYTDADVSTFQDYWVSPSTTYRYRVYAYGEGGSSLYSNEAAATTPAPPPPPNAPTNATATAISTSQINVAWSDNSSDENGFVIEWCVGAGCTGFSYLASLGAGSTSFSHSGLSSNTVYRYRVYAHNSSGNSGYSNVAEARTFNQAPFAHYSWSCKNGSCTFQSNSWDNDGTIVSYAWNFGDGTAGTGATTTHVYKGRGGVFQVALTVTDDRGATGSLTCAVDATNGRTKTGSC